VSKTKEASRTPKEVKPKRVRFITGTLRCIRKWCRSIWDVVDLNPERETVLCPVCGSETDIKEGLKYARE
jgi:hypothetical protein